jgi:hypothetical protein
MRVWPLCLKNSMRTYNLLMLSCRFFTALLRVPQLAIASFCSDKLPAKDAMLCQTPETAFSITQCLAPADIEPMRNISNIR